MKKQLILLITFLPLTVLAQSGVNWYYNIDENNLALGGYDPVTYYEKSGGNGSSAPSLGNEENILVYNGIKYHFKSQKNLKRFQEFPDKYLPKYGGWCAYRMAQKPEEEGWAQSRIPADPTLYKIIDGQLYLFSRTGRGSMKDKWEEREDAELISRADDFWASRQKLAAMADGKPAGLNTHARMENILWDRFIGKWDGQGHQMIDTLSKKYFDFQPATWTFYYGYDGFCIQDDWKTELNFGGTWNGPAIRGYDPLNQEWHMTFIPVNANRKATWLMTGKFDENLELEGYFEGVDFQGREFQQKIFFYNITKDHFSWKAHRSYNKGKTWIEKFTYTECERIE